MVATAEKYQCVLDCGAEPSFTHTLRSSATPVASHNEQRSSTNGQHEEGQIVDAVVSWW